MRWPYYDLRGFVGWYAKLWHEGGLDDPLTSPPQRILQIILFAVMGVVSLPIIAVAFIRFRAVSSGWNP